MLLNKVRAPQRREIGEVQEVLRLIDASAISLPLDHENWARFTSNRIEAKLHMVFDPAGVFRLNFMSRDPRLPTLREIVVRRDDGRALRLVSNEFEAPAERISELYRLRWSIELFFKWIKQNLKIKKFPGASKRAVKTQIIVAMIAYLLIKLAL